MTDSHLAERRASSSPSAHCHPFAPSGPWAWRSLSWCGLGHISTYWRSNRTRLNRSIDKNKKRPISKQTLKVGPITVYLINNNIENRTITATATNAPVPRLLSYQSRRADYLTWSRLGYLFDLEQTSPGSTWMSFGWNSWRWKTWCQGNGNNSVVKVSNIMLRKNHKESKTFIEKKLR